MFRGEKVVFVIESDGVEVKEGWRRVGLMLLSVDHHMLAENRPSLFHSHQKSRCTF